MSQYTGNGLKDTIMRFWIKRRDKLVTDYSLVGYMLSPNPKIMAHCDVNKSSLHVDAADRLIEKLILDPMLVGTTRREKLADLIDKFKDEYGEFTSKRGKFAKDNIWMVAAKQETEGFRWHAKYSIETTEVLGRLACLVLSKILGIGTAERNWKQVKKVKKGDRAKTGVDKTTKQVLIFSQHQMMRGALRRTALSTAGKLWDDNDFASIKMDEYCKDLEARVGDVDEPMIPTRIVRLWQERWEVPRRPGGKGHAQLIARMEKKYIGLKLDEMEKGWNIYTIDEVNLTGCRQKKFVLRAVTNKYDDKKGEYHLDNSDEYDTWEINPMTYACIAEYYKNVPGDDGVVCYQPEDDCDSDEAGDEWEWVGEGKAGLLQGKK